MKKFLLKSLNNKIKLISVSVIVLIMLQMLILVVISNNRRVEQFNRSANEEFSNSTVSMDERINYMKEAVISLSQQPDVNHILFYTNIDRRNIQNFRNTAETQLSNIFAVSGESTNIYAYNSTTNSVYSTGMLLKDIDTLPDTKAKNIILSGSNTGNKMTLWVDFEELTSDENQHPSQSLLHICYFPSKQSNSCLLMDVDFPSIINTFDAYKKHFSSEIFIASEGRVVYGSGTKQLSDALERDLSYISRQSFGYPVFRHYNGIKYLTLKKASENSVLNVFGLVPDTAITSDYSETKILFSVNLCILILTFLAFFLFLLLKNISQTINENTHFRRLRSEEQMYMQFEQKKKCLAACLTSVNERELAVAGEYIQALFQKDTGKAPLAVDRITVSLFKIEIDNFKALQNSYSAQDVMLYKYGIVNICDEILSKYTKSTLVEEKNAEMFFLIIEDCDIAKKCRLAIEQCRNALKNYLNVELSGFLSDNGALASLPELNKQIITLSGYRFISDSPCFITSDLINNTPKTKISDALPLLDVIFSVQSIEARENGFNKLFTALENMRPDDVKNILWIFMFRLYNIGTENAEKIENIETLVARFNEIQGFRQMRSFFDTLYQSVFPDFQEKTELSPQDHTVITVQAIIERSFREPDFCSDRIADELNSSKAYLSRKYKKLTGTSISEEIISRRLKAFANALVTTDKSVKTIIDEVGGTNYNYYMALFKKKFALTPTEYRHSFKK